MKKFAIAFAALLSVPALANDLTSQEVSDFLAANPEFQNQNSFTVLIKEDRSAKTKVFLSKNMGLMPSSKFSNTPQAVQCEEGEDEICTTTTKNGRVIEQSCKCQ